MCTRPVHKTCSGRSRWAADHEGSWKCDCKPEKVDDEEEEKRKVTEKRKERMKKDITEGRRCRECNKPVRVAKWIVKCKDCE